MRAGRRTARVAPLLVGVLALVLLLVAPAFATTLGPDGLPLADDLDALVVPSTASSGVRTVSQVVPITFPFEKRWSWVDTWGAPRSGGRTHEGNDIMVPKMTKLLAVVDGTMDGLNLTGKLSSYNNLPYYNILLRGDDGNDYFYIHLNNDTPGTDDAKGGVGKAYAPGMTNGTHVKAGQFIGYAGDSGNAEDTGSHLHFEVHPGGYKNPVDPYDSLKASVLAGSSTTTTEPSTPPTGGSVTVSLSPFTDVNSSDWFYKDLVLLSDAAVVRGGSDAAFHPYTEVTRAHFASFLVRALRRADLQEQPPAVSPFGDVSTGFWAYREVTTAARLGLVKGVGDGSLFAPDASITRSQMAAMLSRTLGLLTTSQEPSEVRTFPDVSQDYWASREIAAVQSLGLIKGAVDGAYHPEETAMRAHAIAVVARAVRLEGGSN